MILLLFISKISQEPNTSMKSPMGKRRARIVSKAEYLCSIDATFAFFHHHGRMRPLRYRSFRGSRFPIRFANFSTRWKCCRPVAQLITWPSNRSLARARTFLWFYRRTSTREIKFTGKSAGDLRSFFAFDSNDHACVTILSRKHAFEEDGTFANNATISCPLLFFFSFLFPPGFDTSLSYCWQKIFCARLVTTLVSLSVGAFNSCRACIVEIA